MKLAAYYNSWDDWEMLQYSLKNIRPLVDLVIVVISYKSNYGENRSGPDGSGEREEAQMELGTPVFFRSFEPNLNLPPSANETAKRNYGLQLSREFGATHALCMDTDEFYNPDDFNEAKRVIEKLDLIGSVVNCNVYFKFPTLTIGKDVTRVPFIHKITPKLIHTFNKSYPYAWEGLGIRIDPTRSYSISSGVTYWPKIEMEHMSYVRKDLLKKIRNSTAKGNINQAVLVQDFINAKDGYFCQYYQKRLYTVENRFNIPCGDFLTSSENLSLQGIR